MTHMQPRALQRPGIPGNGVASLKINKGKFNIRTDTDSDGPRAWGWKCVVYPNISSLSVFVQLVNRAEHKHHEVRSPY